MGRGDVATRVLTCRRARALPGGGAGTLCSTWVLRRFIVQPAGPMR